MKPLKTSDLARAAHVHPNTIRAYEALGMISAVPRGQNGYRHYDELHMDQVRLIRINLQCSYLGGKILAAAYDILYLTAKKKLGLAHEKAVLMVELIERELNHARQAFQYLEDWVNGQDEESDSVKLSIREAANLLDVTVDMLYDWERNGLITIPRIESNGYRIYGSKEIKKLRVIRMLRKARFSNMAILRVMNHLDHGLREDLMRIIDTSEPDDELSHCFTDNWISTLNQSLSFARQGVRHLEVMMKKYPQFI
jgi:DNA-binding transcriptional MerR regulator